MPWLETSPMDQRMQFIADYQRGLQSMTELADRFDISRKTAYKWIDRYEEAGPSGLTDRSRRPHQCPHATAQELVDTIRTGAPKNSAGSSPGNSRSARGPPAAPSAISSNGTI